MENNIKENFKFIEILIDKFGKSVDVLTRKQIEDTRKFHGIKPQGWIFNEENRLKISRGKYNWQKIISIYTSLKGVMAHENSGFIKGDACGFIGGTNNVIKN